MLALLRKGLSNEGIAERLGISVAGVKYHVTEILTKLGLENRHDAARWQPEDKPCAWLLTPLHFWRGFSGRWLSPTIAGALAVGVAVGVALFVWALLATGGRAATVALPASDRLAFIGADGNLRLTRVGTQPRRLTVDQSLLDSSPLWSPDGRHLLFSRTTRYPPNVRSHPAPVTSLWLADPESAAVTELLPGSRFADVYGSGIAGLSWSPDSRHVAYLAQTGHDVGNALWVADLSGKVNETVPPQFAVTGFAWSPDGRQIALAAERGVVYPQVSTDGQLHIPQDNGVYVVDASGGSPKPIALIPAITQAYKDGERQFPPHSSLSSLGVVGPTMVQWSSDGAYVAFQDSVLSASASAEGEALFTVAVSGGAPVYHGVMLRSPTLLDWFPNSHRFAFTLGSGREAYLYKCLALAVAGVAGATVPQPGCAAQLGGITPDLSVRTDGWPSISPNGKRIAFQASEPSLGIVRADIGKVEGPREGIWIAAADGSDERQLTAAPDYLDFFPRWSADGKLIMFVRLKVAPTPVSATPDYSQPGQAEIWLMRSDGSGARPIVTNTERISSYYGLFEWEAAVAWYRALS